MSLQISRVLSRAEVAAIKAILTDESFASGKNTAAGHARSVKNNEQVLAEVAKPILAKVEAALLEHPVFQAAAVPKQVVKMLISRYGPGMEYGTHVDAPIMSGQRTDLSFTLFLSAPEDYEGGALVIETALGEQEFRLSSGSLVLYPTTCLHRVVQVQSGQRLVIVGWVRSFVRDAEDREILFDLENILASLNEQDVDRGIINAVLKVKSNLLRKWAED